MVVLEGSQMAATLGGQYAQGAPALKIVQKRFLGLHQWLSPVYSKEIKEQLVSVTLKCVIPIIVIVVIYTYVVQQHTLASSYAL